MVYPEPGIGYGATQAFLREGAEVMAVDSNEEMLDKMLPNPGEGVEASASRWCGRGVNCASGSFMCCRLREVHTLYRVIDITSLSDGGSLHSVQGDRHH